jgi:hypothetical protein
MVSSGRPPVTVAIPLHRSAPFVEVVVRNIAAIDVADAEIIVSDRTVEDDSAARVGDATADDPRVRVIASPDGLGWVEHHAALLAEAAAPLAMLMPHDDDFPGTWVRTLVEALDDDPQALVAFGDLRDDAAEDTYPAPPPPRRALRRGRPAAVDAARIFTHWPIGVAYRGVLRLDRIEQLGIHHRRTRDDAWSDDLFMFEIALEGTLRHVPGQVSLKRHHPGSTHDHWSTAPTRTARLHATALGILLRRGRDRTLPWALALVGRRWVGWVVMDLKRRAG